MKNIRKTKWHMLLIILALSSIFVMGCRMVSIEIPPNKKIRYYNWFFDSKIGVLEIQTVEGSKLRIEQLDSQTQSLQTINKVLDIATKVP